VVMERPVKAESAWDLAPSTLGWAGWSAATWGALLGPALA